ncbi:MAG: lipoate--protein ligase family protein [Actinobacteria bacterium]|nr:lipoate--protein ligase family protein [Actinomycetota bacterium]
MTRAWRLLPTLSMEGAAHMALDQALLESACEEGFPPTLRFMRWEPPALSLGRFQDLEEIDLEACRSRGIEVVRRPTGGRGILHLDDFTYSIVLPATMGLSGNVAEAYAFICRGIVAALYLLGIEAAVHQGSGDRYAEAGGACFTASTQADLKHAGRKICGSAQLWRGRAVLQHGSLLIEDRSTTLFALLRFVDEEERRASLAAYRAGCVTLREAGWEGSWEDVASSFRRGFEESFRVSLREGGVTSREGRRWRELLAAYRSRAWLENRRRQRLPGERPRHGHGKSVKMKRDDHAQEEEGE